MPNIKVRSGNNYATNQLRQMLQSRTANSTDTDSTTTRPSSPISRPNSPTLTPVSTSRKSSTSIRQTSQKSNTGRNSSQLSAFSKPTSAGKKLGQRQRKTTQTPPPSNNNKELVALFSELLKAQSSKQTPAKTERPIYVHDVEQGRSHHHASEHSSIDSSDYKVLAFAFCMIFFLFVAVLVVGFYAYSNSLAITEHHHGTIAYKQQYDTTRKKPDKTHHGYLNNPQDGPETAPVDIISELQLEKQKSLFDKNPRKTERETNVVDSNDQWRGLPVRAE